MIRASTNLPARAASTLTAFTRAASGHDPAARLAHSSWRARLPALSLLLVAACAGPAAPGAERALSIWQEMEAAEARAPAPQSPLLPVGGVRTDLQAVGPAEALALAVERSPEVALEDVEAQLREAQVGVAKQLENPEVRITNIRPTPIQDNANLDVALRVPVPRPWTQRARVHEARLAAQAARSEVGESARRLRARVYDLFARLALARGEQALAERAIELRARRRVIVQSRVDKAVATRLDLQLEEVAVQESSAELRRLQDRAAAIEDELRRLCGPGELRFVADPGELARPIDVADRRALVELALRQRPTLAGASTRVAEAETRATIARGSAIPWFRWAQVGYAFPNAAAASWGVGFTVEVPLLSWRLGQVKSANAEVRMRRLAEEAAVAGIVHEVDEARGRALRSAERARALESGLVHDLDEALSLATQASDAGALDPLKVLDVELRRLDAQRRLLEAHYEHRQAVIDLEAAVGATR
ncbi:MAG: TolC family protein [Nannocystaceae bacterium]